MTRTVHETLSKTETEPRSRSKKTVVVPKDHRNFCSLHIFTEFRSYFKEPSETWSVPKKSVPCKAGPIQVKGESKKTITPRVAMATAEIHAEPDMNLTNVRLTSGWVVTFLFRGFSERTAMDKSEKAAPQLMAAVRNLRPDNNDRML